MFRIIMLQFRSMLRRIFIFRTEISDALDVMDFLKISDRYRKSHPSTPVPVPI